MWMWTGDITRNACNFQVTEHGSIYSVGHCRSLSHTLSHTLSLTLLLSTTTITLLLLLLLGGTLPFFPPLHPLSTLAVAWTQ